MPETLIPDSPEALEEMLNDEKRMRDIITEPKSLQTFITNYARTILNKDKSISVQVREETQAILAEMLKEQGTDTNSAARFARDNADTLRKGNVRGGKGAKYNNKAAGAKIDNAKLFDDPGQFLQMIWNGSESFPNGQDLKAKAGKVREIMNSLSSSVPSDGGFLIPEQMRSDILGMSLETAVVRPRATVFPMSSLTLPIPAVDTTTHVGSLYGGIQTFWTEEGVAATPSQPSFSRVVLRAKKLMAYTGIPNELMADAIALMAFIDQAFPNALSFEEDDKFFNGTGVGEPEGWRKSPALITVDPDTTNKVSWNDVTTMFSRMLPQSLGSAVWVCAPDIFPVLAGMTFGTGQFPVFVPIGGGGQGGIVGSILGRPVIVSEKNPALGTDGALSFVDFSFYLIGDRQEMYAAQSTEFLFSSDMTAFKFIERVDGKPWVQSAITLRNGSTNTVSPYVQLAATHT